MGLNLDVDHVAFASDRKFDGWQFRRLNSARWRRSPAAPGGPPKMAAGTTGRCLPFEPELVERLEAHAFDTAKVLQWRNAVPDFCLAKGVWTASRGFRARRASTRALTADDVAVLEIMSRDMALSGRTPAPDEVERLWE